MAELQATMALRRANEVRARRTKLKREAGTVGTRGREQAAWLATALDDPCCSSMSVVDLLDALPRMGEHYAERVCAEVEVWPGREVGLLTERQRAALVRVVGRRGGHVVFGLG